MTHPGRPGGLGGSEGVVVSDPTVLNPANDIALRWWIPADVLGADDFYGAKCFLRRGRGPKG